MLFSRRLSLLPSVEVAHNGFTAITDRLNSQDLVGRSGYPVIEYAPYTLPTNFVPPGPSARLSLPLEPVYRASYNNLEYLKLSLQHVAGPGIADSFAAELQPDLAAAQATLTRRYTATFKTVWPHRIDEATPTLSPAQNAHAQTSITALLLDLDRTHARLAAWAASRARVDLSPGSVTRHAFTSHGSAIWATRYAALKRRVDTILQSFTYRGQPLRYVGSLTHGLRGAHKGRSAMDLDDFDVDLFVVHAAEWRRLRPHVEKMFPAHFSNGKIFPRGTDLAELTGLGEAVGWALAEGLQGCTAAAEKFRFGTEVVLREEDAY